MTPARDPKQKRNLKNTLISKCAFQTRTCLSECLILLIFNLAILGGPWGGLGGPWVSLEGPWRSLGALKVKNQSKSNKNVIKTIQKSIVDLMHS